MLESEVIEEERNASDREIKSYLSIFFNKYKQPNGEIISNDILLTKEHCEIVRLMEFNTAVDIIYMSLKENGYQGSDVVFLIKHQRVTRALNIPKQYIGGLILLYMKLVMGYDL